MATAVAEKGSSKGTGPRQSDGHRRLRVRRICCPRPRAAARPVHRDGLPRGRSPQAQERHPPPAARLQLHHQRRAGQLRRGVRPGPWAACAMAFRVKDAKAAHARALKLGATDVKSDVAEGELDIPAIEGIGGSRLYLVDRYGAIGLDLRRGLRVQIRLAPARGHASHLTYIDHLTHNVRRAVCTTFTRSSSILGDPLLRHRGQGHRPVLESDDLAVRQDPHSLEREPGTTRARSRSSSANTKARASSTSRSGRTTSMPRSTSCGNAAFRSGHARHLLRAARQPHRGPRRSRFPSFSNAAY